MMTSLIFEIPVIIGAIEISRIVLFNPLAKVTFPYFKTATNETGYTKYLTAATIYYLLLNNFLLLPIYFLQIVIGSIIIGSILCMLTPLWEILTTSFKFSTIDFTMYRKKSSVKEANNALITNNEILIKNNERKQILQLGILLSKDNNLNILKKSIKSNQIAQQSTQPNTIIIMSASVLVKLTKLLTVTPQRSKPTHYQACRKHRSRSMKYLPTYNNNSEQTTISRRNSLLICDSDSQATIDASEIHVAPPSDLFLSEKINELDKEINDLNEHEKITREQSEQNDKANVHKLTRKIQELISQIKRQKQQYQDQVQENVISKDVTKLSIPAFTVKKENSKRFAVYVIMVQRLDALTGQPKAGWIVPRRYNEFSLLNQHLKNHYSKLVEKFEFPGKTLFNSLDNSFLESRRVQLENYLQGLLTKDVVCEDREFLKFLSKEN